ncbi:LytR C-terminal domain-containing protein [Mobiluncus curtisii]|uniref:LytR C-terminal domain-containing protein n=1 Tax=Mobiluncus curtisii TaxID=2051 RepID=UPI00146FE53A|nr:LytR C-terminal domain-containing protein [Mobiluncus curtisii]MCV0020570.1 hypothetical protein [Mobiluncus curtisii]NMW45204.1 hypothetical protein [Mobiluncus curtisii]NMW46685.1 hypothetical protein [Mobiluncus curtisii]NMW98952.1 hypothetical protein [Mobiluncus curtisii]
MDEARYPEDEFDRIGKNLPQGAHRPGQPWWHGFLPFVIVIIAAPLLAWAMLLLIGSHPSTVNDAAGKPPTSQTPNAVATPSPSETEKPSKKPAESAAPSEEPTQTTPPTAETKTEPRAADKTITVSVLNASGINGLAAKVKDKVAADGFTKVSAENFQGTKPSANTIYYPADHEAEAREVQRILNIDMIVPKDGAQTVQIVLVGRLKG